MYCTAVRPGWLGSSSLPKTYSWFRITGTTGRFRAQRLARARSKISGNLLGNMRMRIATSVRDNPDAIILPTDSACLSFSRPLQAISLLTCSYKMLLSAARSKSHSPSPIPCSLITHQYLLPKLIRLLRPGLLPTASSSSAKSSTIITRQSITSSQTSLFNREIL